MLYSDLFQISNVPACTALPICFKKSNRNARYVFLYSNQSSVQRRTAASKVQGIMQGIYSRNRNKKKDVYYITTVFSPLRLVRIVKNLF